jgi:alpha-tubulin suppressor-like RCC1 family protein
VLLVATAGIVSATTLYGDGTNITGIALTIAPLNYNPALNGVDLGAGTGIGFTFNQAVKAGSGEVTLRQVGAAGTVVQTWGVGSSITYSNGDEISMSLVSNLAYDSVYHLSYPSGAFTNIGGDVSYVGTGYTFDTRTLGYQLFKWGANQGGQIGDNTSEPKSSPIQIPGTTWLTLDAQGGNEHISSAATKNDGTMWVWGWFAGGQLGLNQQGPGSTGASSPTQLPGTNWTGTPYTGNYLGMYNRVGGELWVAGNNAQGGLGQNDVVSRSSPVQIPGTTWATGRKSKGVEAENSMISLKTDGTLWAWGRSSNGNTSWQGNTSKSSPTQIPGTTWRSVEYGPHVLATKTDNTLWTWGVNEYGQLGLNDRTTYSSPKQIPGTDWGSEIMQASICSAAIKTDGTLWSWGYGGPGVFGTNQGGAPYKRSSPVQCPGTTWSQITGLSGSNILALKTDGTLWSWGEGGQAQLGHNDNIKYSSPVQIPGDWAVTGNSAALKNA